MSYERLHRLPKVKKTMIRLCEKNEFGQVHDIINDAALATI
jgi:hypothetical protein